MLKFTSVSGSARVTMEDTTLTVILIRTHITTGLITTGRITGRTIGTADTVIIAIGIRIITGGSLI